MLPDPEESRKQFNKADRAPIVPDYKPVDSNQISSNLALAYGIAGFFMFYATLAIGILAVSWTSGVLIVFLGLFILLELGVLITWRERGRKEPLIGFIIALVAAPLISCGLCAALYHP